MEIELRKWGNSIGFRIPRKVAESYGLNEYSIVELTEAEGALIITKKQTSSTLDELLDSIPNDFQYPNDVQDFVDSGPLGQEFV